MAFWHLADAMLRNRIALTAGVVVALTASGVIVWWNGRSGKPEVVEGAKLEEVGRQRGTESTPSSFSHPTVLARLKSIASAPNSDKKRRAFWAKWGYRDPVGATEYLLSLNDPAMVRRSMGIVLESWSKDSPADALAFLQDHQDQAWFKQVYLSYIRGFSSEQLEAATAEILPTLAYGWTYPLKATGVLVESAYNEGGVPGLLSWFASMENKLAIEIVEGGGTMVSTKRLVGQQAVKLLLREGHVDDAAEFVAAALGSKEFPSTSIPNWAYLVGSALAREKSVSSAVDWMREVELDEVDRQPVMIGIIRKIFDQPGANGSLSAAIIDPLPEDQDYLAALAVVSGGKGHAEISQKAFGRITDPDLKWITEAHIQAYAQNPPLLYTE